MTDTSIKSTFTFAGFPGIESRNLARQMSAMGLEAWFMDKANSFEMRTGRLPSVGWILLTQTDYKLIANPNTFTHELYAEFGGNNIRVKKLAVLQVIPVFTDYAGPWETNAGREDNAIVLVKFGDARAFAQTTDINDQFNVRIPQYVQDPTTLHLSYNGLLTEVWDKIRPLFDSPLTIDASVPTLPMPDDIFFLGPSAWDALFSLLDHAGLRFLLNENGDAFVFQPDGTTTDDNQIIAAIQTHLIEHQSHEYEHSLPEKINVGVHNQDFQWYQETNKLTPQDYYRRRPVAEFEFNTSTFVSGPFTTGTVHHIWAPLTLRTDETAAKINESQVQTDAQAYASSHANLLKNSLLWRDMTFAGIWPIRPGKGITCVRWSYGGEGSEYGLRTQVISTPFELSRDHDFEMVPWEQEYVTPGIPVVNRKLMPWGRDVYGEVIGVDSFFGTPPDLTKVAADAWASVAVLSGVVKAPSGSWTQRTTVRAINFTGEEIAIESPPKRVFCRFNYQLGDGGEWVIVTAQSKPSENKISFVRLIDPILLSPAPPKLGDMLSTDRELTGCIYGGFLVTLNPPSGCDPEWVDGQTIYAHVPSRIKPQPLLSFGEIYIAVLSGVHTSLGDERPLFEIVAPVPPFERVFNNESFTFSQFQIMGINELDITVDPAKEAHHLLLAGRLVLKDYDHFAVAVHDISPQEVGWGWTKGTVPACVFNRHSSHEFAWSRQNNPELQSGYEGSARIIKYIESNLALVQLGILTDVQICARVINQPIPCGTGSSGDALSEYGFEINNILHDCFCGCLLEVNEWIYIYFSRTDKRWRVSNWLQEPKIKTNLDCLDAGEELAAFTPTRKFEYYKPFRIIHDPFQCLSKIGIDGEDGSVEVQVNTSCANNRIIYDTINLLFQCGVFKGVTAPITHYTECCLPDCVECDQATCNACDPAYEIDLGEILPTGILCNCVNHFRFQIAQIGGGNACEWSGGGTIDDCDNSALCICHPVTRKDINGNDCVRCSIEDDETKDMYCGPLCTHGMVDVTAVLKCIDNLWVFEIGGATEGKCPQIQWLWRATKPFTASQCPDALTWSGTTQLKYKCPPLKCDQETKAATVTLTSV